MVYYKRQQKDQIKEKINLQSPAFKPSQQKKQGNITHDKQGNKLNKFLKRKIKEEKFSKGKLKDLESVTSKKSEKFNHSSSIKDETSLHLSHYLPVPIFVDENTIYLANFNEICVFNATNFTLLEKYVLHKHKILAIKQIKTKEDEIIVYSCDLKGHILKWYPFPDKEKETSKPDCFDLPVKIEVTHFSVLEEDKFAVALKSDEVPDASDLLIFEKTQQICDFGKIDIGQRKVCFTADGNNIVAILTGHLLYRSMDTSDPTWNHLRSYDGNPAVMVEAHPTQCIVAVAKLFGQVHLYYPSANMRYLRYHWHTAAPNAFCFSPAANAMYSGGLESVLICFNLVENSRPNQFCARMGTAIAAIAVTQSGDRLAVVHVDRRVNIVNRQSLKLEGYLRMVRSHLAESNVRPMGAGLHWHKGLASLVKNGLAGMLNFFHPFTCDLALEVDVAVSNIYNKGVRSKDETCGNADVSAVSFSSDGAWMATAEQCCIAPDYTEVILRFWKLSKRKLAKIWEVNTDALMPSSTCSVSSLLFQPKCAQDSHAQEHKTCAVVTQDGQVRIWRLLNYTNFAGKEEVHWNCYTTLTPPACSHQSSVASATYSNDGSVLAVAKGNMIALWTASDYTLLATLRHHAFDEGDIKQVAFCRKNPRSEVESLLCACNAKRIMAWDLVTQSLVWSAPAQEPYITSCMQYASTLVVFTPQDVKLVCALTGNIDHVTSTPTSEPILCAAFVPDLMDKNEQLSIAFFNTNQQYFTIRNIFKSIDERTLDTAVEEDEISSKGQSTPKLVRSQMYANLLNSIKHPTNLLRREPPMAVRTTTENYLRSIKNIMKELSAINITTLSYRSLTHHLEAFLPDISIGHVERADNVPEYTRLNEDQQQATTALRPKAGPNRTAKKAVKALNSFQFDNMLDVISKME